MEELVRGPWRLGRVGRVLVDLTVAVTVFGIIVFYAGAAVSDERSVTGSKVALISGLVVLVVGAQLLPLLWRRRHPLIGFTVVSLACAAQVLLIDNPLGSQIGFPVAVYAVARYASMRWGIAALAVGLLGSGVAVYDWIISYSYAPGVPEPVDSPGLGAYLSMGLAVASFPIAGWALGALARTRSAYVESLLERNEQLHREAEHRAELGATQERARIAREMHDVVAHGLSVIVVQADGARYAAAQDPSLAPQALETVAQTAREALAEMRQLLGLLRDGDVLTRPQPRLGDIATLVEEAQAGGATVTARLPGLDAAVPEGVALTAFRVVQESLSNVRKHAGPGAATEVTVTAEAGSLAIEVTDDGRGAAADPTGESGGLGLVGMAERIATHDGTLETGPASGGGFRVYARLPL